MRSRLEQLVRGYAGDDLPIADATTFAGLGLDSGDMIALVLDVEAQLRVRLPDRAIAGLTDFAALHQAVLDQVRSEVPA